MLVWKESGKLLTTTTSYFAAVRKQLPSPPLSLARHPLPYRGISTQSKIAIITLVKGSAKENKCV